MILLELRAQDTHIGLFVAISKFAIGVLFQLDPRHWSFGGWFDDESGTTGVGIVPLILFFTWTYTPMPCEEGHI